MTGPELTAAIKHIDRTLIMRWWIFAAMLIAVVAGAIGAFYNLNAVQRIETIVTLADSRSRSNEATIESAIKQQIIYQQQLAQYMDFLSNKNPKVKVPRVLVHPPVYVDIDPGQSKAPTPTAAPVLAEPLTEAELTRNSETAATPPAARGKTKSTTSPKRQPKPTPTATPFRWPWTKRSS